MYYEYILINIKQHTINYININGIRLVSVHENTLYLLINEVLLLLLCKLLNILQKK